MREGIIIEYRPMGAYVKVSAIDAYSGREVSIVGAASATREELSDLAARKLEYVMKKETK